MSPKYLQSLLTKSAAINQEIAREHRAPQPDSLRLLRLKKLRLAIKDTLYSPGLAAPGETRLAQIPVLRRPNHQNA
jgi:uncharacterized protein YdcH (DUF465 family)